MKILFQILLLFLTISLNAQQKKSADYYAQIPEKIENEREIRIYKDFSITNQKQIFRIYVQNKQCNAEFITLKVPFQKQINSDEFENVKPEIIKFKCSDETFMNFELRNIQYLPKEEYFNYKKLKKTIAFSNENKQKEIVYTEMQVVDGNGYYARYRNGNRYNQFFYSNPETYLKEYPEIDELKDFMEILNYIETEFKIKF